jgi:hypothetical protein
MHRKKLQVFVSSTYTDMLQERQAAVEAILESGHIPAGMELFAAGDESQMSVIQRWIDESDVFLLILGARYGSIEPKTAKSYIHLEYEYALSKDKPYFCLVLNAAYEEQRAAQHGLSVIERENPQQLRKFIQQITNNTVVKFWTTPMEIKLAIFQKMAEFAHRDDLKGWVPGDQAFNVGPLAEEIARLTKENSELRKALANAYGNEESYGGLSFPELKDLLRSRKLNTGKLDLQSSLPFEWTEAQMMLERLQVKALPLSLLHLIWAKRSPLRQGTNREADDPYDDALHDLRELGLVVKNQTRGGEFWNVSNHGRRFLLRLEHEVVRSLVPDNAC